jgi:hypothetical protein
MQRVVVTAVGAGAGRPVSRLTVVTVVTATEQDLGVYVGVYTCIHTFGVYTRVYESKTSVYHKLGLLLSPTSSCRCLFMGKQKEQ